MNGQDTRVMIFAVSVALLSPPAKAAPWSVELSAQEEAVLVSAEELRKAERALLEGQSGSDRLHALLTVLRHASGYSALPGELERLLVRATADPNREVAELAERALFLRSNPPEPEAGTEEEIRARRAARELLEIEEALTGWQGSPESRFDARAAIRRLAHHATKHYVWSPEIEWMVERARRHEDPEVVRIAELILAKREGREIEPAFARFADPKTAASQRAEEESIFALAQGKDAATRLEALHRLMDRVLGNDTDSRLRARVRDQMLASRADPDSRVSAFAAFMVAGLDGDLPALRQVYVGRAVQ